MTVIIGLKHEGQNYIAADRRITAGYDLINDDEDKIYNHNNCLIGFAGGVAEYGVFKKILMENKDMKIEAKEDILDLYLKLRQVLKDHGVLDIGDYPAIEAIFVTDKNIFELGQSGDIISHKTKCSIGSGAYYAMGIMDGYKITKPEKDLKTIIKKVSKYSLGVSPNSIVKVPLSIKMKKILKKATKSA